MSDEFIPTINQVGYAYVKTNEIMADGHDLWGEYHRFLAQQRAEAKVEALREAAEEIPNVWIGSPPPSTWLYNRADQIEGESDD